MNEKRAYIRKAFQMYVTHKNQLSVWERELKELPVPGESGLDYSHESVSGSSGSVETQFAKYADCVAELTAKIADVKKKVELVRRTIEHFKVEDRAKGKLHYKYICVRWLGRRSYRRAAIELEIGETTADYWIMEIFDVAEAIAEEYDLF